MHIIRRVALMGGTIALSGAVFAQAPLGSEFTYQGHLVAGGSPASGSHDLRFRLLDSSGGEVAAPICFDGVEVVKGLFTVPLNFGFEVFDGQQRQLEVSVRADATPGNCSAGVYSVLSPNQRLTATPYALQTRGIFVSDTLNIGVGTTTPAARLEVNATTGSAVIGRGPAGANAVYGMAGGPASFIFSDNAGVRGDGTGTSQAGLLGVTTDYVGVVGYTATGVTALFGRHDGPNGRAIVATATQTGGIGLQSTGETAALLEGKVNIDDFTPLGIQFSGNGEIDADTGIGHPADGVLTFVTNNVERARIDANGTLLVNSTSMNGGVGTKFHSQTGVCETWNTDTNSAVAGETSSGVAVDAICDDGHALVAACQSNTVGIAGLFVGRVNVIGTLTASTKNFRIDHPLDPANQYLEHGCVESDQYVNLYRGNVELDAQGAAWVELPKWFGKLNRNFSYQLTAIGAAMPGLHIATEIADNRFQIAGGQPGGKVSWQVTGERQDVFARAHPLVIERAKAPAERGRYLHPVEQGVSPDLWIGPLTRKRAGQAAPAAVAAPPVTDKRPAWSPPADNGQPQPSLPQ